MHFYRIHPINGKLTKTKMLCSNEVRFLGTFRIDDTTLHEIFFQLNKSADTTARSASAQQFFLLVGVPTA